jgi:hypothetical protein
MSNDDLMTAFYTHSRKRCHVAVKLLYTLIPGFQEKVSDTQDLINLLSPVGLS